MSRAFVSDKEDWVYCPKAGERCMHAATDKTCSETSCEHFDKEAAPAPQAAAAAVKVVAKKPKEAKAERPAEPAKQRATKKSKLKKPKKWGGRSGSGFWILP